MEVNGQKPIAGWREYVSLPDWGVDGVIAKIDTGARTSAIHVEDIEHVGKDRVRFEVVKSLKNEDRNIPVEARIERTSQVRSSTGHAQERIFVRTRVRLGPIEKEIELSLVCRKHMLCRMLIGRTSLGADFFIDASRPYHFGRPKRRRTKRKKTR